MYSYRIEQAVRAASILHKDQMRSGIIPIPVISHLVAVAFILMDYTDDEDVVIAGLLHQTLEDTDYTSEELRNDFGIEVQKILVAISNPQEGEYQGYSWRERKQYFTEQLHRAPEEALLVATADIIHTMRSTIEHYTNHHKRFCTDFEGTPEERLMVYQNIANTLNRSLNNDSMHEFNHVFEEYKKFIADVKKTNTQ